MKLLVLLLLVAFVVADVTKSSLYPDEYKENMQLDERTHLYWNVDASNNQIEFCITLHGTGWVAMSFDYEDYDGMKNADTYVAWHDGKEVVVKDAWLKSIGRRPIFDENNNPKGSNNVIAKNGELSNGHLTVKFIRSLELTPAHDQWDKPIKLGVPTKFALAYHKTDPDYTKKHCTHCYTKSKVIFNTPKSDIIIKPAIIPDIKYKVVTVVVVVLAILGILTTYIRCCHFNFVGVWIFHRRLIDLFGTWWQSRVVQKLNYLTDFEYFLDYTIGELSLFLLYIGLCIMMFVNSWLSTLSQGGFPVFARAMGIVAAFNMALMTLPVARYSIWKLIFGISFERAIKFHYVLGCITWLTMTAHGLGMLITYAMTDLGAKWVFLWNIDRVHVNLAGFLTFIPFTIMAIFAMPIVRRKAFEVFWHVHYLCMVTGLVMLFIHDYMTYWFIGYGVALLIVDWILRIALSKFVTIEELKPLGDSVTKVTMAVPHSFNSSPGQYIFLSIPRLGFFESHPFSIAQVAVDERLLSQTVTLYVRNMGNSTFTGRLSRLAHEMKQQQEKNQELLSEAQQQQPPKLEISARIEGPYGNFSLSPSTYNSIVLVAGGIGITPMLPVLEKAAAARSQQIFFVWSVREAELLLDLKPTFDKLISSMNPDLHLSIHFTGDAKASNIAELFHEEAYRNIIKFNRLNIAQYFKNVEIDCCISNKKSRRYVGVYACGPKGLIGSVQYSTMVQSNFKITYMLHKESFTL